MKTTSFENTPDYIQQCLDISVFGNLNIYYTNKATKVEEYWISEGERHFLCRTDGPSLLFYRNNGKILLESYFNSEGDLVGKHRTDGPAVVGY